MRRWSWRILGLFLKSQTRAIIELLTKMLTNVKNISWVISKLFLINNLKVESEESKDEASEEEDSEGEPGRGRNIVEFNTTETSQTSQKSCAK